MWRERLDQGEMEGNTLEFDPAGAQGLPHCIIGEEGIEIGLSESKPTHRGQTLDDNRDRAAISVIGKSDCRQGMQRLDACHRSEYPFGERSRLDVAPDLRSSEVAGIPRLHDEDLPREVTGDGSGLMGCPDGDAIKSESAGLAGEVGQTESVAVALRDRNDIAEARTHFTSV
jgi:hypothetical protein